jgi:ketosteroid isomerase-like protein
MTPTTAISCTKVQERLRDLHRYIREGRILEAMNDFYADDVTMQENANPPTVGLKANIEREKQFLSNVKEWKGFEVKGVGGDGDVTFYEAVFDFVTTDNKPAHLEQVSVARWHDGKIVHERFYYDTAGMPKA